MRSEWVSERRPQLSVMCIENDKAGIACSNIVLQFFVRGWGGGGVDIISLIAGQRIDSPLRRKQASNWCIHGSVSHVKPPNKIQHNDITLFIAPHINIHPFCSHISSSVKARWAFIRVNYDWKWRQFRNWEKWPIKCYSAPGLNGQPLSSHFVAVKAGWPIIRANLM